MAQTNPRSSSDRLFLSKLHGKRVAFLTCALLSQDPQFCFLGPQKYYDLGLSFQTPHFVWNEDRRWTEKAFVGPVVAMDMMVDEVDRFQLLD
jgi:hypothetical protein